MKETLVAVAVAACACGHGVRGDVPSSSRETLGAQLERVVGRGASVAIVGGSAGLRAVSSDGLRQRTLVSEPVDWVIVDPRADVVWFGTHGAAEIDALDLGADAEPAPRPTVVVTGLPGPNGVSMVGPVIYGVLYLPAEPSDDGIPPWANGPDYATGNGMNMARAHLDLFLGPEPSVRGGTGYEQNPDWEAAVGKAPIPGRAFLRAIWARPSRARPPAGRPPGTHIDGIDPDSCEQPQECGSAEVIVGTKYLRVMTANVAGDVRHITYQLYDTEAKKLVDSEWASWFDDAVVSPDHHAFLVGGAVVRFEAGPLAVTPREHGAPGGGWLGGGDLY